MRKKTKILTFIGLSICFLVSSVSIIKSRAIDVGTFNIGNLQQTYELGSEFSIPDGNYELGDELYNLSTILTYPDGRTTSYEAVVLDKVGKYSLEYYTLIGSDRKSTTKTFDVIRTTANQFTNENGCTFTYGVNSPDNMGYWDYNHTTFTPTNYKGIKVNAVGSDASFRYNGVIDLNSLDVSTPLLSYAFTPYKNGNVEINDLDIYLIDIYDENNYIHIHSNSLAYGGPYQNASSLVFNVSDKYSYVGLLPNQYDLPNNSFYGARNYTGTYGVGSPATCCSFYGRYSTNDNYITSQLFFDYKDLAMYANNIYKWRVSKVWKVMDFDSEEHLGLNVWNGFTTGEVYMKINLNASASGGYFFIDKVNGLSLSEDSVNGDILPTISVQGVDGDTLPYGIASQNQYYPIMKAVAYSPYCGIIDDVKLEVFYGIFNEKVPVYQNKFLTDKAGEYRLVYTAYDEDNRSSTKTFKVIVKEKYDKELSYVFNYEIKDTYAYGIDKIYFPDGKVDGGSGNVTTQISVTYKNNPIDINLSESVPFFVPTYSGEYKLISKCVDFLGNEKEFVKTINVQADGVPIMDKIYLPDAIRKGYETLLPIAKAFVKNEDGTSNEVQVQTYIGQNVLQGNKFTPNRIGDLEITYKAVNPKDDSKISTYSKTVKVLEEKKENYLSSYLYSENATFSNTTNNSVVYKLNGGNSKLGFANVFCKDSIEINLGVPLANKIVVTLYDSLNVKNSFSIEIVNKNGVGVVYHNNNALYEISDLFSSNKEGSLVLIYQNETKTIKSSTGNVIADITTTLYGEKFNGLSSGAYLNVEIINANADSLISIYRLGNQTFSGTTADWIPPIIELNKEAKLYQKVEFGQTVKLISATGYDVMSKVESLKLIVTSPSGQIIFNDNIDTNSTFVPNEYGLYSLVYTAEDSNRNVTDAYYVVDVLDTEAPTITTKLTMDKYLYKVGEKIVLKTFNATDNCDKEEDLQKYVVVVEPTGMYRIVNTEYSFSQAGTYLLRYTVKDSSYNVTYVEFVLIVS